MVGVGAAATASQPAPPTCLTLRALAEAIKAEKPGNVDLCEELDVFCASRGRAVELLTFAKFPIAHRLEALRKWCGDADSAYYELCDRLGLLDGACSGGGERAAATAVPASAYYPLASEKTGPCLGNVIARRRCAPLCRARQRCSPACVVIAVLATSAVRGAAGPGDESGSVRSAATDDAHGCLCTAVARWPPQRSDE